MLKELKEQLEAAPTVEKRLATYFKIVDYFLGFDRDLAQQYISEGLKLAEEAEHFIFKALFLLKQLSLNKFSLQSEKQFVYFIYLIETIEKIQIVSFYYYVVISILVLLPTHFKTKKMNEKIIFLIYKTIDLFAKDISKKEIKETEVNFKYMLYKWLFMPYIQNGEREKAVSVLHLAAFFLDKPINMDEKAAVDTNWVFYFWLTKQPYFCMQAIEKVINNPLYSNNILCFYNIQIYIIQGKIYKEYYENYDLAIKSFAIGLKISKYFKNEILEADIERYIAEVYEKKMDFENFSKHIKKSLLLYTDKISKDSNQYVMFLQNLVKQTKQTKKRKNIFKLLFEENTSQAFIVPTTTSKYDSLAWYNYIAQNCNISNFGVKEIAIQFNISNKTLSRHIQEVFGMNTQKFITFVRMELAHQLLLQTDKKILEIAEAVGFENISHFGRVFKKQFGMLPSACRKTQGI